LAYDNDKGQGKGPGKDERKGECQGERKGEGQGERKGEGQGERNGEGQGKDRDHGDDQGHDIEHLAGAGDFLAFLRLKNLSPRTSAAYSQVLRGLTRHLGPTLGSPAAASAVQLRQYVAGLLQRGLKPKTVSLQVTVLKRFFGYLFAEGHIQANPALRLPMPKVGKRLPRTLSLDETVSLLSALDQADRQAGGRGVARRDKVLFFVTYTCGLRIAEAISLRLENLDLGEGVLRVIGKGNKERRVYLKPAVGDLLRQYAAAAPVTDYLFPGRHGGHLADSTAQERLKIYVARAGLRKQVSALTLRHSIAVHYLQAGAPVSFVQDLLGHASLATTGIYLQLTDQMTKEITRRVETASERTLGRGEGVRVKELQAREGRVEYEVAVAGAVEAKAWHAQVGRVDVMEWLS
jgi:integrase/recombinase XerD